MADKFNFKGYKSIRFVHAYDWQSGGFFRVKVAFCCGECSVIAEQKEPQLMRGPGGTILARCGACDTLNAFRYSPGVYLMFA